MLHNLDITSCDSLKYIIDGPMILNKLILYKFICMENPLEYKGLECIEIC